MGRAGGVGTCLWRDTCSGRLVGALGIFPFPAFPALEDARTGYVSDGWALVLSVCGALLMISREAFLPCLLTGAGMGALYGLLYLISKNLWGWRMCFWPRLLRFGCFRCMAFFLYG